MRAAAGKVMLGEYIIKNGELVPAASAAFPVDSLELTYGFGVYESLRLRHGRVFFLDEHIARLFHSAQGIELEHWFTIEKIQKWCGQLVKANKDVDAANIKMLLIGGATRAGASLCIFLTAPKFLAKKDYREGVRVITFEHERFRPEAKTLNMLPSYLAYRAAERAGAFDALFIDRSGKVREGTRSNFFVIKDHALTTPPPRLVLDGITRRHVIACAREHDCTITEAELPLAEIFTYDSAFLTNTSGGIVPVRMIDNKSFKEISPALQKLRSEFEKTMTKNG